MISEKTVELNITTELVNWLYVVTDVRPYILAPSQRQEGTLGFDATIGFPTTGRPFLLQYKRAEYKVRTNEYVYHLNHNTTQDQHLRLFVLELLGWDVYYALPKFHLPNEVVANRQHLLPMTLFIKPSSMIPTGGNMTGHHDVRYNATTRSIKIHSDKGAPINKYSSHKDIADLFRIVEQNNQILGGFLRDFNSVFANTENYSFEDYTIKPVSEDDDNLYQGMTIMIK
jgi:hypothetical protein